MRTNGYSKSKKFMYDSQQLYQHLEDIRLSQKNQCPMCKISYDVINRDIDHIIPICTAKTIEDINRLFQLSNLTLLCWKCNRHVKGGNYKCL